MKTPTRVIPTVYLEPTLDLITKLQRLTGEPTLSRVVGTAIRLYYETVAAELAADEALEVAE